LQFEDFQFEHWNLKNRGSEHLKFSNCPASNCPWNRDEWDVTLGEGTTYRLFCERGRDRWFVEGIID
jgi:hypothetical protein